MRNDCIDCGASGTPVREAQTDVPGVVSRVRRCDSCDARFAEWYDRWQASLRRGRGPKVTLAVAPIVRPTARAAKGRDRETARLAMLDLLG